MCESTLGVSLSAGVAQYNRSPQLGDWNVSGYEINWSSIRTFISVTFFRTGRTLLRAVSRVVWRCSGHMANGLSSERSVV